MVGAGVWSRPTQATDPRWKMAYGTGAANVRQVFCPNLALPNETATTMQPVQAAQCVTAMSMLRSDASQGPPLGYVDYISHADDIVRSSLTMIGVFDAPCVDDKYSQSVICNSVKSPGSTSWTPPSFEYVPEQLKRDFCVIAAAERLLSAVPDTLYPLEVVQNAMISSSYLEGEGLTSRSLAQVANHILRKCAYQINEECAGTSGVDYVKSTTPHTTIGHLKLDAPGVVRMLLYLRGLLGEMSSPNLNHRYQWHASRTSRKKAAKRVAAVDARSVTDGILNPKTCMWSFR